MEVERCFCGVAGVVAGPGFVAMAVVSTVVAAIAVLILGPVRDLQCK